MKLKKLHIILVLGLIFVTAAGVTILQKRWNNQKIQMVETESNSTEHSGAVITIIDDDGYSEFLNQWKVVSDKKGIKSTVAVYKNRVGQPGAMTISELQSLKAEGFEIVSHSVSHPDINTVDEETWDAESAESKDFIISNHLGNGEVMVYPKGFTTSTEEQKEMIKKITSIHFKYGVDALGGVNFSPVDPYEVNRQGMPSNFDAIKGYIDEAAQKDGWLIFLTHSQNNWNGPLMEQWIDYAQSLDIPILPFSEAEKLTKTKTDY